MKSEAGRKAAPESEGSKAEERMLVDGHSTSHASRSSVSSGGKYLERFKTQDSLRVLETPFEYTDEFHEKLVDMHADKGLRSTEQLMILQVLIDYCRVRDHFLR